METEAIDPNKPDTALIRELADFIETVPSPRFDFSSWCSGPLKWLSLKKPLNCGTTGCGLGWATVLPKFKNKGLEWSGETPTIHGNYTMDYIGQVLFNIREKWTNCLFIPSKRLPETCTPKEWAANARWVADSVDEEYAKKCAKKCAKQQATPSIGKSWASTQASAAIEKPASLASS